MIDNTTVQVTAGITALVVVGTALALGTVREGPSDDLAAAGSPLYGIVVKESIRTLDQQPGGPGAAKSDVCPDCGQVHAPAVADGEVCPDCGQVHAPAGAAGATPHHRPVVPAGQRPAAAPAGAAPHHRPVAAAGQRPAAAPAAPHPVVGAGQQAAVAPSATRRGFAHPAGGVCPDCGQIHPLPAAAAEGAKQAVPAGVPANSYYCPSCKTYHPRPVPGQTPVVNPHTPPLQLEPSE